MPSAEQFAEAKRIRDKVTFALSTRELTFGELLSVVYPEAEHDNKDPDYQRMQRVMTKMREEGKIKKTGGLRGPWHLKAKPHVDDLPAPKRGYAKREQNGASNGVASGHSELRAYLIRDIEAKLAELKALG